MKLRNKKGFTLIEVIVVAGIIAVLAGILVPLIFKEIDESKNTAAKADVRSISSALIILKKDTGQWPISGTCSNTVTLLTGAGTVPTLAGNWVDTQVDSLDAYLSIDDNGCWPNKWKGPYMAVVNTDPWGNAYVINADAFVSVADPKPPIWIISAGPDGVVDTAANGATLVNDDIGLRLR
jgi:general secretion pathway protein G